MAFISVNNSSEQYDENNFINKFYDGKALIAFFIAECRNSSSSDSCHSFLDQLFFEELRKNYKFKISLAVFYAVLFFVGVLGNLTVIICVLKYSFMRTVTNMFLLNLAVSDMLVFLLCEPWTLAYQLYPIWLHGSVLCKLQPVLQGISVSVSIYTLVSISVQRFIIVHHPKKNRLYKEYKKVTLWIASVWIFSFLICLPLYFAYEVRNNTILNIEQLNLSQCEETWGGHPIRKQIYTILLFCVLYVFPISFMGVVYLRLSRRLWSTQTSTFVSEGELLRRNQRKKFSLVLIALFATSALCWLPYHCVNIFVDFMPKMLTTNEDIMHSIAIFVYPIAHFFGYSNSAIDPYCSLFLSAKFKMCLQLFRQRRNQGHRHRLQDRRGSKHGRFRFSAEPQQFVEMKEYGDNKNTPNQFLNLTSL